LTLGLVGFWSGEGPPAAASTLSAQNIRSEFGWLCTRLRLATVSSHGSDIVRAHQSRDAMLAARLSGFTQVEEYSEWRTPGQRRDARPDRWPLRVPRAYWFLMPQSGL
jgi:hypothetical protein